MITLIVFAVWLWLIGLFLIYTHGENHVFYGHPGRIDWLVMLGWPVTVPLLIFHSLISK